MASYPSEVHGVEPDGYEMYAPKGGFLRPSECQGVDLYFVRLWSQTGSAIALVASLSSPPASLQEEHHQEPNIASFNHEGSPRSTTSSVWTAPSPSQLEQSTSPTLPQGPRLVGEPRTPVSSGRHQRTSSVYYTASWGSPYQPPELSSDKATQGSLTRFKNTEDLEEPSPVPQLRFKYLLSTNQSPEGAPAASTSRTRRKAHASKKVTRSFGPIPANQEVKKPDRSSTEDWIRQYLSGQSNSERGNWWSDDSGGSETRTEARSPKRLARVNIEDWLDPEDEGNLQGEAGNPKFQTDFIRRQESARATPASLHKTREQGEGNSGFYEPDTGDIFGYPQELKNKGNYMAEATLSSKFASPYPTPMEEIDLNLPGPTADEPNTKSASSMDKSAPLPPSTPVGNKGADLLSPDVSSTPAKSTTQPNFSSPARTGQRPKKRTVWRGRNCVIALPLDETRGKPGGAPPPLTHEEDDERLRAWESEGFDTSSFKLATAGESQSRGVYPGSEDERSERKQGKYSVSIPDRRKWEAYVDQLKEQKLRALGVSFGHEDANSSGSMGPSPMSRQTSAQFAMSPISPALPISAMTGQSVQLPPKVTPLHSRQHSRVGSVASPGLRLTASHVSKPSVSPLASPLHHPLQQQPAPAQPMMSPPLAINSGQPVIATNLPVRQDPVQQTHVLHQPQPRAILAHRLYGDNSLGTLIGTAERRDVSNSSTLSSTSWTDSMPTSTDTVLGSSFSKPSNETAQNPTSRLNVEAKEFAFGPTGSTLPRNFSFNSGTDARSSGNLSSRPFPFSRASSATYSATRQSLNVAAAPFQPSSTLGALLTGNFDFSSAGPTFKQDTSNSLEDKPATGETLTHRPSAGFKGMIFGAGSIVKPPKKNKAIPIVKPDEGTINRSSDDDDDEVEDESGRITQGIGRQKRLRRGGGDDDDVPQFAIPSELPGLPSAEPTVEELGAEHETTPSDKENITPDDERLKARLQPVSSQRGPSPTKPQNKERIEWDHFAFRSHDEDVRLDAALPRPSSSSSHNVSVFEDQESAQDSQDLSAQEAGIAKAPNSVLADTELDFPLPPSSTGKHSKYSSLSATAESFKYQPSATTSFSSSVGAPATHDFGNRKSSNPSKPYPNPNSSSPHALNESPATTLRPSEVGSFRADIPQPRKHSPYYEGDSTEYDALAHASVEEIDAVMEQLNGEDSDLGVERAEHIWGRTSPKRAPIPIFDDPTPAQHLLPNNDFRSDAPSPSPSRAKPAFTPLARSPSMSAKPSHAVKAGMSHGLSVHRLNTANDRPASDWDDVLSPAEEAKLEPRTHFFDNHVNDLVGGLLQQRLDPLEKTLYGIQKSLSALAMKPGSRLDRRSISPEYVDSDADDEDESDDMYRPRTGSPKRDRKLEQIRTVMTEVLYAHKTHKSSLSAEDNVLLGTEAIDTPKPNLNDEVKARRAAEDKVRDLERQLLAAEEEKASLREIAEDKIGERREHDDKHHQALVQTQMRIATLEDAQENLQGTVSELQDKNAALEDTLAEYRLSSNKWREEIAQTNEENRGLSRTVELLKVQIEESMRVREGLRGKFDKLQEDMASAAREIANDQAAWAKKEGDHKVELEVAAARLVTEERARAQLEKDVERLRLEEKEAIRLSVVVEETLHAKKEIQATVDLLRQESLNHQQIAARLENEVQQARETRSSEVHAAKASMVADLEAAQHELKMVRADLESQLARARTQVENAYSDAADAKVTSTSLLQEAMDAQRATIEDLRKETEEMVRDRQSRHETQLKEIRSQHERALCNAKEDRDRIEAHSLERLALTDAKSTHLQDRVTHLEERLEIAKCAAHAAAQAAQSAKGTTSISTDLPSQKASESAPTQAPPSNIEKVSPQALRESILVLQEQLQERELIIESLQQEIATFDRSLPTKIKERDSEVEWLRELIGVRVADLQDIITTISSSQTDFDRDAVKDAAIRLKAGLEMELQERERANSGGGQAFSSLASVSAFASPRATQLAAAWGNWRKGKESHTNSAFRNLAEIAASSAGSSPSKMASKQPQQRQQQQQRETQSFFSGLMTPPPRQTSRQGGNGRRQGSKRSEGKQGKGEEMKPIVDETQQPPETPTLLREEGYDQDAVDGKAGYFDERGSASSNRREDN